jgi:hypothetical protein
VLTVSSVDFSLGMRSVRSPCTHELRGVEPSLSGDEFICNLSSGWGHPPLREPPPALGMKDILIEDITIIHGDMRCFEFDVIVIRFEPIATNRTV